MLVAAVGGAFVLLGSTNSPVSDPIAQAATLSSSSPGYRMNLAMSISAPGLSAPITGYGHAVVDLRDQAASLSFAIDLSGEPQMAQTLGSTVMNMDMIVKGPALYMRFPAAAMRAIPGFAGKQWLKIDPTKVAGLPAASSLGDSQTMTDPSRLLQYLRASSSSVTNEGYQRVNGVQTTHYHVILDLQNVAADLSPSEQNPVQQSLSQLRKETGLSGLPVDVWIDSQRLVRRVSMSLPMHEANGAVLQQGVTADLTDYGPQPQPTLPPAGQVEDLGSLIHIGG